MKMPFDQQEMACVESFASVVAAFCTFVEQAHTLSLDERLTETQRHLLRLYAGAVALPDHEWDHEETVEAEADGAVASRWPEGWAGYGKYEYYWEFFHPYEKDSPVAGHLTEDVLDIYRDVREGLGFWRAAPPRVEQAIWTWRYLFQIHWGAHAIDALRALHAVLVVGVE